MDILMVNPVHPATPHISAARVWRFARELSTFGHRVVLLTKPLQPGQAPGPALPVAHDWSLPFVLECAGEAPTVPVGGRLRSKIRTAVGLLRHGGSDGKWHDEASRQGLALVAAGEFRPEVVWATFGKGEALFVARKIATTLGCPWVMDIKDNWELYVPAGLRRLMAWRVRGWSKATANAQLTAACVHNWHAGGAEVVYSGVDDAFLVPPVAGDTLRRFVLNLVGSVYSQQILERFLRATGKWMDSLDARERSQVSLYYYGADVGMVAEVAAEVVPEVGLQAHGYTSIDQFGAACVAASVNAYLSFSMGFHHKLLELLAAGRPIIAMPAETRESMALVAQYGTPFHIAADEDELVRHLDSLYRQHLANEPFAHRVEGRDRHSWPNQARQLESILKSASRKESQ